ncbi:hypothetical protein DL95DRAFT_471897 [Leptodontidium sp. 2 PMI_412]|nr:hypothetical protein DL95DRAFT_471897 [Leptodontidium sp. 2 PMI_412]
MDRDSETASNTSASSSRTTTTSSISLRNRPILNPTPPSTRHRSPSPTRKVLSQLRYATPSLRVCQPDVRVVEPSMVRELIGMLVKELTGGVIPMDLKPRLQRVEPNQFSLPSPLFETHTIQYSTTYLSNLWRTTVNIYNDARACNDDFKDENAWMTVVTSVLKSAIEYIDPDSDLDDYEPPMLNVQSVQTQAISSSLLPTHTSTSFAKKADLALAFSLSHPEVFHALEPIHTQYPDLCLSQMEDAYTMRVPLVAGVEVKERGGSYNEATVQLGVWCAAGLEKLRRLREEGHDKRTRERGEADEPLRWEGEAEGGGELPPFVGWTVVGHEWKLHVVWKDRSGNVTVLGPWRLLNAGTGSHAEILVLLALIRRVERWVRGVYWPWLRGNVLDGLGEREGVE